MMSRDFSKMAQATKPGNAERGWNDPPLFLHVKDGKSVAVTPPKRHSLTKRVFHTGITGPGPAAPASHPPPAGSLPPSEPVGAPPRMIQAVPKSAESMPDCAVSNYLLVSTSSAMPSPAIFTPAVIDVTSLNTTSGVKPATDPLPAIFTPGTDTAVTATVAPTLLPAAEEIASLHPADSDSLIDGNTPAQNVVLFPPTSPTSAPNFPAPLIIPNMETAGSGACPIVAPPPPGSPTATNVGSPQKGPLLSPGEVDIPHFADDLQLFLYVHGRLQKVLHCSKTNLPTRVLEDITKKLGIFETMWKGNRMSYQVKAAMAKLALALHEGKCDLAHEIHLQLMLDYVSEVGQWMVAVKRLIQESRILGPLSPSREETSKIVLGTLQIQGTPIREPTTVDSLSTNLGQADMTKDLKDREAHGSSCRKAEEEGGEVIANQEEEEEGRE